jgi:hypothetical protein
MDADVQHNGLKEDEIDNDERHGLDLDDNPFPGVRDDQADFLLQADFSSGLPGFSHSVFPSENDDKAGFVKPKYNMDEIFSSIV